MRFNINKTELQNALTVVSKGVATRSTLPVLSGIYIDAHNDEITLQSTDLELSVRYSIPALVEESGRVVFPGKLFSEIVKSLPDSAIHIESSEDTAIITCDASSFSIKTLDAEDFPGFPQVDVEQEISIPFTQFSSMVKHVARVVSKDESHAVLTGVLVTLEEGLLKMVATDSYRLGITQANIPSLPADDFQAVISGSFLQEIASLPKSDEEIKMALAENQIVVTYKNTVFINRRIEGNFPNYRQLLPDSFSLKTTVDTEHLIAAVKRASLLSKEGAPVKFAIDTVSKTIQLSAVVQDVGSAQETLPCETEGEDTEIAFNFAYVLEGLSSIETDKVVLELQSSLKPGIFKAVGGDDYLYLVMPVRIS